MSDSIVAVKEYLKQNLSSQDPTPDFIGALPSIAAWRALIFCQSLSVGGCSGWWLRDLSSSLASGGRVGCFLSARRPGSQFHILGSFPSGSENAVLI